MSTWSVVFWAQLALQLAAGSWTSQWTVCISIRYDAAILTHLFAAAQSPVFLHTPQNTGSHNLQFDYNQALYTVSPFLAPGQTKLQIDATDAANPLISFVSPASPIGQSGAVTVCKSPFPLIYFSTAFVASGWGAMCFEAMFSSNPSPALHWHPTWLCMPQWGCCQVKPCWVMSM